MVDGLDVVLVAIVYIIYSGHLKAIIKLHLNMVCNLKLSCLLLYTYFIFESFQDQTIFEEVEGQR